MRISTKAEYAVRALVEIGRREATCAGAPVPAENLAEAQDLPRGFLLAILADLRRAGIVHSQRGQSGGWLLARPADEVTIADIIRAVDGPLASVHGLRPEAVDYGDPGATLQLVWIAVRSSLREVLEAVTLGNLVRDQLPAHVTARTCEDDAWHPH